MVSPNAPHTHLKEALSPDFDSCAHISGIAEM